MRAARDLKEMVAKARGFDPDADEAVDLDDSALDTTQQSTKHYQNTFVRTTTNKQAPIKQNAALANNS